MNTHVQDTHIQARAQTDTENLTNPNAHGGTGCIHISIDTFMVRGTCTKTSANTTPPKTHTHTLTSYLALHAKPVSPQVVEKRVREAWSQDGPG